MISSNAIIRILISRRFPQGAHFASANLWPDVSRLECVQSNGLKLSIRVDVSEPKAKQRAVLVAMAGGLALDVRRGHKLLETRAGRQQVLTAALCSFGAVHHKAVARPQVEPAGRTRGQRLILTVQGYHISRGLAHRAATNEVLDAFAVHRFHAWRHGLGGGQPVGVVLILGVCALVVNVAAHHGHRGESLHAAATRAEFLATGARISVQVEQRVAVPERRRV